MGEYLFYLATHAGVGLLVGWAFYSHGREDGENAALVLSQAEHRNHLEEVRKTEKARRIEAYQNGYNDGVADERIGLLEAIRERAEGTQLYRSG